MRCLKTSLALGLILLIAGCVASSLHPLFTEKDLAFDSALLGTWAAQDEEDTLTFSDAGEKSYELVYSVEGQKMEFKAHLVQLGEFNFLDIFPKVSKDHDVFHFIPAHTFWKIQRDGDILLTYRLDQGWIEERIKKNIIRIPHQLIEDRLILTASTEELQELVLKYAEQAFDDFGEFQRQK
jgi:hypothetical protein